MNEIFKIINTVYENGWKKKSGGGGKQGETSVVKKRKVESRVNWPQAETGLWTDSAGTDGRCHCSARPWVPARACQKLAVTLIYTEEPCCFLFSPDVPHDKLKSPPCFMRALWDRARETHSYPALASPGVLACTKLLLLLTCLTTLPLIYHRLRCFSCGILAENVNYVKDWSTLQNHTPMKEHFS